MFCTFVHQSKTMERRLLAILNRKRKAIDVIEKAINAGLGGNYMVEIPKAFPEFYKDAKNLNRLKAVWNIRQQDEEILKQIQEVSNHKSKLSHGNK